MALDIEQIKSFQVGNKTITQSTTTVIPGINPTTGSSSLQKTIESISQLSSKSNEISSFINDASIDGGNQPFNISTFAREFILKSQQQEQEESTTGKVTDSKPITRRFQQITKKLVDNIAQNYVRSGRLLSILEKNVNKILSQSNVNFVSIENGQIVAQPIQSQQVNQAIQNIQKTVDTYVLAIDKYARRVYNTDPILTVDQLRKNLSLNKLIPLYDKILAVKLLLLEIQIKRRKAQDLVIAANAASQVPVPNVALATEYTQRATQYTANELNSLEDLAEAYKEFEAIKKKVEFYGTKYEKTKNQLLNIQQTINTFQSQIINKSLTQLNNQLTGSYNELTGSITTRISNVTGSTTI
jgi:hypothetical protein